MTTVMAFGSFDLFHLGHLYYLKQAKSYGDNLIVILARDQTIKKVKGKEPIFTEEERLEFIKELKIVDRAVLGNNKDYYKVIKDFKPDIICLGYDQNPFNKNTEKELKKINPKVEIIRINPYKQDKYKSKKLRDS